MDQNVHFITVATDDLDATRAFYVDGLGWESRLDVPGNIIFFQVAPGVMLGMFDTATFREDVGGAVTDTSITGLTLSYNVDGPDAVDRVIEEAAAAGATVIKKPQRAAFGGYHGHFADPNGLVWEVCHNPGWRIEADGTVVLD